MPASTSPPLTGASTYPTTALEDLRAVKTRVGLADYLGYSPAGFTSILYRVPIATRYKAFDIPKRSGGIRQIHAPDERLKALQQALANRLEACRANLRDSLKTPDQMAHGFEKGRSILTNAWLHKRRRFVLNIDLQDFFPSINFGRVRGFFMKNRDFGLDPDVATAIAQIACFQNVLPQGAPSSPIISNLIANSLDVRLARLAKRHRCHYTRYADDLTFSSNRKEFPQELAYESAAGGGKWEIGEELLSTITGFRFEVNAAKTRMQRRPGQQLVTGLVVNEKVNVRASFYRAARAMCDSLFKTGKYYRGALSSKTQPPSKPPVTETKIPYLEGIMAHIYHIKHTADVRSGRLDPKAESEEAKRLRYPAYRGVYKKLLYYKHFVALDKPLIVCEGKTDNIYLRSALKGLNPAYPGLATITKGKLQTKVRFLKHSRVEHDILELSGGSGNLGNLVARYEAAVHRYKHRPLTRPVIVLVDNDSGSDPVFGALRKRKITIDKKSSAAFYWVCLNLYVIKTPETGGSGDSCIEDLFPPPVRAVELSGRKLSLAKEYDSATHYGKFEFADKVVRPNFTTIDFSAFRQLLDRVVAVMDDYSARTAGKSAKAPKRASVAVP